MPMCSSSRVSVVGYDIRNRIGLGLGLYHTVSLEPCHVLFAGSILTSATVCPFFILSNGNPTCRMYEEAEIEAPNPDGQGGIAALSETTSCRGASCQDGLLCFHDASPLGRRASAACEHMLIGLWVWNCPKRTMCVAGACRVRGGGGFSTGKVGYTRSSRILLQGYLQSMAKPLG
jgi:hypothetical protein